MVNSEPRRQFRSALTPLLDQYVELKHACGHRFHGGFAMLLRFDRHLLASGLTSIELPRDMTREWLAKRVHERATTHASRVATVRRFAEYLVRLGYCAYVPDRRLGPKTSGAAFTPRIFTHEEIHQLLQAVDELEPTSFAPMRHRVMPEVLRLLYGCGCRVCEVLHLRVEDVDLDRGVLKIRGAKFGKDRLVPPATALVQRLRTYADGLDDRRPEAPFFPGVRDAPWSPGGVYRNFRELLLGCGIPHGGRGNGPRLHDLRHTFAVHTLLRWYQQGADLDAKLPVLATYLGHCSVEGTQRYLHLTAELHPEITRRTNESFGDVIPRRIGP